MAYFCDQVQVVLPGRKCGSYLITSDVLAAAEPLIRQVVCGTCHVWLSHTSCSISISENADPHVRSDLYQIFKQILPDIEVHHAFGGPDDMSAHALSVLCGCDCTIPITDGKLRFGTWQGIFLNEHKSFGGNRTLLITVYGKSAK